MFTLRSIMTKEVLTVKPDTSVYEAANILVNKQISGLPVTDNDNRLLGIISEKDILRLLIDKDLPGDPKVSDFMSKDVKSFTPDDSAVAVCEFLLSKPFRRVPVIEEDRLVGIVSRRDVLGLILRIRGRETAG